MIIFQINLVKSSWPACIKSNQQTLNLVRKPLDSLVSHYNFLRYGDDVLENKVRAKEGDTTTFDECVEAGQPDSDPKKL